jgi:hypothetical protein
MVYASTRAHYQKLMLHAAGQWAYRDQSNPVGAYAIPRWGLPRVYRSRQYRAGSLPHRADRHSELVGAREIAAQR